MAKDNVIKKIVAISGAEKGPAGYSVVVLEIDREIIRLTGKKKPNLLFIPTASGDSVSYFNDIKKHFGDELGCNVDVLYLIKNRPTAEIIREKIFNADIIYVGGGNTLRMMKLWRKTGVNRLLIEAYEKGIVMSGVSAGAICWFRFGNSDSRKSKNPEAHLIKVRGLNIMNALYCPHYDKEIERQADLMNMMKKTSGISIAIENCCAIEVIDEQYRIINSKKGANAYKIYWKNGEYIEKEIERSEDFKSVKELLNT